MKWYNEGTKVEDWVGKTVTKIDRADGDREITFHFEDGEAFQMCNTEPGVCFVDCFCQEIVGNLDDLIGSPLTMSEMVNNVDHPPVEDENEGHYTWTFYKFGTVKGYVTMRWFGTSNGFYSEEVEIFRAVVR